MVTDIWNRNIKAFHSWEVVQSRFHYHVDEEVLWDHYLSIMEQWRHILIEHEEDIFFGGEWVGFFFLSKGYVPCLGISNSL